MNNNSSNELWIFGYGSLIWKADFPFVEKQTGYIKGFLRRFYQNSIDHRGTHDKPGRVVTLIPSDDPESKVWGMGYRIHENDKNNVLEHLDYREQNGYTRYSIQFYPISFAENKVADSNSDNVFEEKTVDIILYVATQDNVSFAGETDLNEIVEQILTSTGKSGPNREYVHKLANAMREFYPNVIDEHLFEIEELLKKRELELLRS